MELWIDGQKLGQDLEDQLNVTVNLTSGNHVSGQGGPKRVPQFAQRIRSVSA
jgi:hypothetical protein